MLPNCVQHSILRFSGRFIKCKLAEGQHFYDSVWCPTASQAAVQDQANKLFASISEANTVLSDPVRRKEVRVSEAFPAGLLSYSPAPALHSCRVSHACRVVVRMVCARR